MFSPRAMRLRECSQVRQNKQTSLMAPLWGLALFVMIFVSVAVSVTNPMTAKATPAASTFLNFQARLLNISGSVADDGNYNVEFKLYDAKTSGSLLWTETRTGADKVRVVDGYLSANLGSVTAFGSINWDQQLFLTMNIGGTGSPSWDGEMLDGNGDRIPLTALPYAFNAGQLAKTDGSGNRGTLSFSGVTTNPVITIDDVASAFVCLSTGNCIGGSGGSGDVLHNGNSFGFDLTVGTNDAYSLNLETQNHTVASFDTNGHALFKNFADGAAAFRVQNSSNNEILTVDTSATAANNKVVLGKASTLDGRLTFKSVSNTGSITLIPANPSTTDYTITLPAETGTVCTTATVCTGYGAGSGSGSYIQNQNSTDQSADFRITGSGRANTSFLTPLLDTPSGTTTLNIGTTNATSGINLNQNTTISGANTFTTGTGTISIQGDTTIASGKGVTFTGGASNFDQSASSGTFSTGTGAVTLSGDVGIASGKNFLQNGAGTFGTGTGAVALNGDVTIASGKNFTQSGAGTFGTGTGNVSLNGNTTVATGKTLSLSGTSATLFQVQDSSSSKSILTVDATGDQLVLGNSGASGITGTLKFNFSGQTGSISLVPLTPASTAYTLNLPAENGTICTTAGSATCLSTYAGTPGDSIQVNSSPLTDANFLDTTNTATVAGVSLSVSTVPNPDTISISISNASASLAGVVTNGSQSFGGNKTFSNNIIASANFDQSGSSGTFDTGTGVVSLNGDVGIATGKNFLQNGTGTFGTGSGNVSLNGNVGIASGKTFLQSGGGTFGTGTGTVSLNGNVNIASGKSITYVGSGDFDQSASSGDFRTSTGNVYINGNTYVATGKSLQFLGGVADLDQSGSSGVFKSGTGLVSLNGNTTIAASKTLTVTSGLTTLTGATTGDALNVSNSTSTGNIAVFKDNSTSVFTIGDGGLITSVSNNGVGFQVQDSANSNKAVLTVDTSGDQLILGNSGASGITGTLKFNFSGQTGSISLVPLTPASTAYTLNLPAENGTICTTAGSATCLSTYAGSGANTALSNLASVAINTSLLPSSSNAIDLGSLTKLWRTGYFGTSVLTPYLDVVAGALTIGTSTATSVSIANNDVTHTINLANGGGSTAQTVIIGSINTGSTTLIQGGSGASALSLQAGTSATISIGTSNANTVTVGNTGNTGTLTFGQSTAGETINIGNGNVASGNTNTINIGATATSTGKDVVTVGSTVAASSTTIQGGSGNITLNTSTGNRVQIGSGTTDGNIVTLQLDSFSTYADSGTCNSTTNQGAMYYSTNTNSIRTCSNSAWQDVVTSDMIGLGLFGVVMDSGANAPGDWIGLGGITSGPCKVYLGSVNTKIRWTGCTAYSGGRKVIIPDQASDQTVTLTNGHWEHVCIKSSDGTVEIRDGTSETNNLPTFSATAPVLCLADLSVNGTKITGAYDIRTFTTTQKELVNNITTAPGLGMVAAETGTTGQVTIPVGSAQTYLRGIYVATSGGTTANSINAIIAIGGPNYAKNDGGGGGTPALAQSAASGYERNVTATGGTANFTTLGMVLSSASSTCTALTDDCRTSVAIVIDLSR